MASVITNVLTRVAGGVSREKHFAIFLRDHMVVSTTGVELARRTLGENSEGELGAFLKQLVTKLESERDTLHEIARKTEVSRTLLGEAGGWLAEKAGRIKLNGRLIGYSPLSRVFELEALLLVAQQRLAFWKILDRKARVDERLQGLALPARIESAEEDLRLLERYLMEAADRTV
jgi:hypothetical protein